jgi:uncharacterized protein YegJ (DUF2314 family)
MKLPTIALVAGVIALIGFGAWFLSRPPNLSVVRVTSANPELQKAANEARKRLPEFLAGLERAEAGSRFAVRVRFVGGSAPEYLWVRDPVRLGERFSGVLDQQPLTDRTRKKGDKVEFGKDAIYDWLMRNPTGETTGGFTEKALAR